MTHWNNFQAFLQLSNFWQTPPSLDASHLVDGKLSLIEGHQENRYRFTQVPDANLEKAGAYLFQLARSSAKFY